METVEIRKLELNDGNRVLDLGCGDGRHLRAALAGSEDVFGVGADLSLARLKDAFRKFWEYPLGGAGSLVAANLHELPFAGGSFEAVICSEVLEHLHDYHGAITEMARILKPGGTIGVSIPMYLAEKGCWKLESRYPEEAGHLRIISADELVDAFESEGFTLIASRGTQAFHTPFWWLLCWMNDFVPLKQTDEPFEHEVGTREWWWEWYEGRPTHPSRLVAAYYAFLIWYEREKWTPLRLLENLLNPVLGRSHTFYFRGA